LPDGVETVVGVVAPPRRLVGDKTTDLEEGTT
jgi:hypothetical protein